MVLHWTSQRTAVGSGAFAPVDRMAGTWPEFVAWVKLAADTPELAPGIPWTKDTAPALLPYAVRQAEAFEPNKSPRCNANVAGFSMLAFDFDKYGPQELWAIVERVRATGYAHLWYGSPSEHRGLAQTPPVWKRRLVVPLESYWAVPTPPYASTKDHYQQAADAARDDFRRIYFAAATALGIPFDALDQSCAQLSHLFYLPVPVDGVPKTFDHGPLDAPFLTFAAIGQHWGQLPPTVTATQATRNATPYDRTEQMRRFVGVLNRIVEAAQKSQEPAFGDQLAAVLNGQPLTYNQGARYETYLAFFGALTSRRSRGRSVVRPWEFPGDVVIESFITSIGSAYRGEEALIPQRTDVLSKAWDQFAAAALIEEERAEREALQFKQDQDRRRNAEQIVNQSGKVLLKESNSQDWYVRERTSQEWIPTKAAALRTTLQNHWPDICPGFVFVGPGKLGPVPEADLQAHAHVVTGIEYTNHGAPFVLDHGVAVLRTSKVPPAAAVYNPQIDEWLTLLFDGDQKRTVEIYCAASTQLDVSCKALLLQGEANAGKSLLVGGILSQWGAERAPTLTSLRAFQSALYRIPVICLDDNDVDAVVTQNDRFRAFVYDAVHEINEKHQNPRSLRGHLRVVIATNDVIGSTATKGLTGMAVDAIIERISPVFIEKHRARASAGWLALHPEHRSWTKPTEYGYTPMAAHFEWLRSQPFTEAEIRNPNRTRGILPADPALARRLKVRIRPVAMILDVIDDMVRQAPRKHIVGMPDGTYGVQVKIQDFRGQKETIREFMRESPSKADLFEWVGMVRQGEPHGDVYTIDLEYLAESQHLTMPELQHKLGEYLGAKS